MESDDKKENEKKKNRIGKIVFLTLLGLISILFISMSFVGPPTQNGTPQSQPTEVATSSPTPIPTPDGTPSPLPLSEGDKVKIAKDRAAPCFDTKEHLATWLDAERVKDTVGISEVEEYMTALQINVSILILKHDFNWTGFDSLHVRILDGDNKDQACWLPKFDDLFKE
jgi:hypothetical protein